MCSTSLAINEMQIKTTLRFHLTPVKMVGIQISATTMQSCMEFPQKAKIKDAI
jgi:hypothetical protein